MADSEWDDPYAGNTGVDDLKWARDFLETGDAAAWGRTGDSDAEFLGKLAAVTAFLRAKRQF